MKFSNELMSNKEYQKHKIGPDTTRSKRNEWAESIENKIRELSPYPISYDVTCTQNTNFAEFMYTESAGGVMLGSQSIDINTRIMQLASEEHSDISILEKVKSVLEDKYVLDAEIPDKYKNIKKIVLMPGHNMYDMVSTDNLQRLVHEDPDVMIKPHPITRDDGLMSLGRNYGWNRILPKDLSGVSLMKQSDVVYTLAASEFVYTSIIYNKQLRNIGMFANESTGTYYAISRITFTNDNSRQAVANMFNCKYSGLLFPWQDDLEERILAFFEKAIELKEKYKPLHGPRNIPKSAMHAPIKVEPEKKK